MVPARAPVKGLGAAATQTALPGHRRGFADPVPWGPRPVKCPRSVVNWRVQGRGPAADDPSGCTRRCRSDRRPGPRPAAVRSATLGGDTPPHDRLENAPQVRTCSLGQDPNRADTGNRYSGCADRRPLPRPKRRCDGPEAQPANPDGYISPGLGGQRSDPEGLGPASTRLDQAPGARTGDTRGRIRWHSMSRWSETSRRPRRR